MYILDQKFTHVGHFGGPFLTIFRVKKVVFWTFFKFVWKCLGNVWAMFLALKSPTFGCIVSSKGCYMTPKIDMFDEKIDKFLRFEGSCLNHDESQKSLFLDFFKVVYDFVGRG